MRIIVGIVLCLCLFISCDRGSYAILASAESLLVDRPDSAYKLLRAIDPEELRGQNNRALYALLYTEAQYKSYDSIKSDSLISIAVNYYSAQNQSPYLHRALMYKGAALEDMGMWHQAMIWYKKAEQMTDSSDYKALGLINIRIADLYKYSYIENYEQIKRYKKALGYYLRTTDSVKIDYLYLTIGNLFFIHNLDSAYLYLNRSNNFEYSDRNMDGEFINNVYLQLYYYLKKEYRKSVNSGLLYFDSCLINDQNKIVVFNFLSRAYANMGQIDSSLFYFNGIDIDKLDAMNRLSRYMSLVEIEKCKGDYKKALEYSVISEDLNDSIRREAQKHNLFIIDKQFDKQLIEDKNRELEYKSNIKLLVIVIMCLALCMIVFLLFVVISKHRRKLAQYSEFIDYLRNESIDSKNTLIEQLDKRNKTEQSLKTVLENKLQTVRELIDLSYRCGSSSDSLFRSKVDSVLKTNNLADGALNDLREIVNAKYFGLTDHLITKHPQLNDKDIHLICLVCCNFSAIEMSMFFNYSNPKTIYSSKSRLCEKLNITTTLEVYLETEIKELKDSY